MKKEILLSLILLIISSCSITGNATLNTIDQELKDLTENYLLPIENPLFQDFINKYGNVFSLKIYKTKFLFFEDKSVWYKIEIIENRIKIKRVNKPITDWYFEININNVDNIINTLNNKVHGMEDVLGLITDIGTEPNLKSLEIANWIRKQM